MTTGIAVLQAVKDLTGEAKRIADALEALLEIQSSPASERVVRYSQLRNFVTSQQPHNRNKGQARHLWRILTSAELEDSLARRDLDAVRIGDGVSVNALKALANREDLADWSLSGLGKARLDLLIRWAESL